MQEIYVDHSDAPARVTERMQMAQGWLARGLTWSGAALSALLFVAIVLWSYKLIVRDVAEVPVIRAMSSPMRAQPPDPGGATTAHQGLEVNSVLAGNPTTSTGSVQTAPPAPALATEDVPATPLSVARRPIVTLPATAPAPVAVPDSAAPVPPDETPAAEVPVDPTADLIALAISQPSTADAPAPPGTGIDGQGDPAEPVLILPRPRPAALNVEGALPPEQSGIANAADIVSGTRLVQLGAFATEADAITEWDRLQVEHGDLLGAKKRFVEMATSAGREFFRLRAVGFKDLDEARALCVALEARGADCIPVTVR